MRHLISPPTSIRVAALRDRLLNSAEQWAVLADQNEHKAIAWKRCCNPKLAEEGRAAENLAKFQRRRVQQFLAQASSLTDYTDTLDRLDNPSWLARLEALAEDARQRALSPAQLNSLSHKPLISALYV